MNQKRRKRASWMITVPLAAAAAAFFFYYFLPNHEEIAELRKTLSAKREFISQAEALRAEIAEAEQEFETARMHVDRMRQHAPSDTEVPAVYERINRLAKNSQVTTTRFDPLEPVEMRTLCHHPVSLAATGTFNDISRFLGGLEQLSGTILLDELKLERTSAVDGAVRCNARLLIVSSKIEKPSPMGKDRPMLPVIWRILIRSITSLSR